MRLYDNYFDLYGHTVGQVLLTGETIRREKARINAENTFSMLLSYGCIPIVNENDTVSSEELEAIATFGDNDRLSAYVAVLCRADVLVILSDIDGLYDSDPRKNPDATPIDEISWADFRKIVGDEWTPGKNCPFDPIASKKAQSLGLTVICAGGKNLENIKAILEDKNYVGTTIRG